jgi:hypothetical protein
VKRIFIRSVVAVVALAIVVQIAGYLVGRYLGRDADPYEDEFDIFNVMGASELTSRAEALRAGSVRTYIGGTELDLRRAELAPGGAYLEVTTWCSGTEILVSPGWRVDVLGTPLAGGHDVQVTDPDDLPFDAPHLVIDASTVCGGLEVRAQALADDGAAGVDTPAAEAAPSTNGAREPETVGQAD